MKDLNYDPEKITVNALLGIHPPKKGSAAHDFYYAIRKDMENARAIAKAKGMDGVMFEL